MQFFVKPGTQSDWYKIWKEKRLKWHESLGLGQENYRFHDHDKLAHYADAACDIEFNFPFGFKELEGIHSRTDFDLTQHEQYSGKKLRYFDPEINDSYVPYVVETSIGLDRMFLAVLAASYHEEELDEKNTRIVLKIPDFLAPYKLAILPLVKKDGLSDYARKLYNDLFGLGLTLLKWLDNCLPSNVQNTLSESLEKMMQGSEQSLLRILHYPPIQEDIEPGAIRAAAHEDINLITLLVAGSEPGLQAQDKTGKWHDISSDPGMITINNGDMLAMASENFFPSTPHRVINPEGKKNNSRYSIPMFLHPRPEVMLSNVLSAESYLQNRLKEIGLK